MNPSSLVGIRLLEERKRLGQSQSEAATAVGVSREMWGKYERGAMPGGEVFLALVEAGFDVPYLLTGQHSAASLNADEQHLISLFRAASLPVKMAAVGALQGASMQMQSMSNTGHGAVQIGTVSGSGSVRVGKAKGKN